MPDLQLRQERALVYQSAIRARAPAWLIVVAIVVAVILAIVAVVVLVLAGVILCRPDLRRLLQAWLRFRPVINEYSRVMKENPDPEEQRKALQPLHEKYGPKIADNLAWMGGMYVKVGQFMSLQQDVPQTIRESLRILWDSCKGLEPSELRGIVEAELRGTEFWRQEGGIFAGSAIDRVFDRFDMKPLGVASISQVHRARLRQNGREVVVKVQLPNAEAFFAADIWLIKRAIGMTLGDKNWSYVSVCEIEQQIAQEFDFLHEARNIDKMREVCFPELAEVVELPEVWHDLTTKSIVTMSFLEGVRLDRALVQKLEAAGLGDVAKVLKLTSGDPDQTVEEEAEANEDEAELEPPPEALAAADCQRIVDALFDVWGHCVLRAGVFNADPHPGNVLVMPDGKLGLIDFGQVKQLTSSIREAVAGMIVNLLRADVSATAEMVSQMGVEVPEEDASTRMWYHASHVFEKKSFSHMQEQCWGKDGGKEVREIVFLVRSTHILRGVALGLGFPVSLAEAWGKRAARTVAEEEEVGRLVTEIGAACCAGSYDLTVDDDQSAKERGSVGTMTLQHAQGSLWFGGTWSVVGDDGARTESKLMGFLTGRTIEMKAGETIIRGIVRKGGDCITHIRTWDAQGKVSGRYAAVRTSGAMGRTINSLKAKAAAAVFRFAPAATKAKLVQAVMKPAAEESPEG